MSDLTPAEDPTESVRALATVAADFGLGYVTLDTDDVIATLERLKSAEDDLRALGDTRPCGRFATHPPHKWMTGRKAFQCAGVGDYDQIVAAS